MGEGKCKPSKTEAGMGKETDSSPASRKNTALLTPLILAHWDSFQTFNLQIYKIMHLCCLSVAATGSWNRWVSWSDIGWSIVAGRRQSPLCFLKRPILGTQARLSDFNWSEYGALGFLNHFLRVLMCTQGWKPLTLFNPPNLQLKPPKVKNGWVKCRWDLSLLQNLPEIRRVAHAFSQAVS